MKILASNFFQKVDTLKETIEKHKVLTVFELYALDIFSEAIENLKHESPLDLLMKVNNRCTYDTRRTEYECCSLNLAERK